MKSLKLFEAIGEIDDRFLTEAEDYTPAKARPARTALRWLAASYDGQCIIFTCHRRELQILEEEKIPFHRINI